MNPKSNLSGNADWETYRRMVASLEEPADDTSFQSTSVVVEIERAYNEQQIYETERDRRMQAEQDRQTAEREERQQRRAAEQERDRAKSLRRDIREANVPELHKGHDKEVDQTGAWGKVFAQLSSASRGIFFLIGRRGSGKTQLAVSLILKRIGEGGTAYYTTQSALCSRIRSTYRRPDPEEEEETECEIIERCTKPGLLVIDEIGRANATDWSDRVLFDIVDERYAANRLTLLIGNVALDQVVPVLGASIVSRLNEAGGISQLAERNYRDLWAED
jgi:DNA replication protein DnaC